MWMFKISKTPITGQLLSVRELKSKFLCDRLHIFRIDHSIKSLVTHSDEGEVSNHSVSSAVKAEQ